MHKYPTTAPTFVISVYSSEKLDGLCAAAIIFRHATLAKLPAHFAGFLHPESLTSELQELASEKNKLLFLLDCSFAPEHLALIDLAAKTNKIVYTNTTDLSSVKIPAKFSDQHDKKSSAEQAQERFLPHDSAAKQLARLAHEHKFWKINDDRTTKLADLLLSGYSTLELIETLSKGMFWNERFESAHQQFTQKKNAALDELLKTITIKTYLTHRIGFCLANNLISPPEACDKMLSSHAGIDIACCLFRDGRLAFRRRDSGTLDLKAVAEIFGGGGQPYASGAKLIHPISKENFTETLFKIDTALKAHFVGNA